MEDEKALKKIDLLLIYQLDKKVDYSDKAKVQSAYDMIIQKNKLNTDVGKRFTYKLKQIIDGTSNNKCLFCDNAVQDNAKTVFCPSCEKKLENLFITTQSAKTGSTNENMTSLNHSINKADMQNKIGKAITSTGEKVGQVINDENIQKVASTAKKVTSDAGKKIENFADKNNVGEKVKSKKVKKVIPIIAAILVIAILSAIGWEKVFLFCSLLGMAVLIYDIIKKKTKKIAIIVTCVFLALTGIAGAFVNNQTDLSSLVGTNSSKISADFKVYFENPKTGQTTYSSSDGTANLTVENGIISSVSISDKEGDYNYLGIQIGDKEDEVKKILAQNNYTEQAGENGVYHLYLGQSGSCMITLSIGVENGVVSNVMGVASAENNPRLYQ